MTDDDSTERVRGAADPRFGCVVSSFTRLFPKRNLGGGALSVYLDGIPVVDVWTGYADRNGEVPWTADTASMVFSATKGMSATVIHRLVDRGLLSYDAPVADYWPAFATECKTEITVADLLSHRAGLSHLHGVTSAQLVDHRVMEDRVAAAVTDHSRGESAYHAFTFGWLVSGLARAVTGCGMKDLFRTELAAPLDTDGLHLGRPPADAPTVAAEILLPQRSRAHACTKFVGTRLAGLPRSALLGSMYFPGVMDSLRGTVPLMDAEIPSVTGVPTARGMARMYGALANGGVIDGKSFLSAKRVAEFSTGRKWNRERNIIVPIAFHLGYHSLPIPGAMSGFGHVGLGGSIGWADPETGMAFALVHNRLLTPLTLVDHMAMLAIDSLIRRAVSAVRREGGAESVPRFGAGFFPEATPRPETCAPELHVD